MSTTETYLVGVVKTQKPVLALINALVAGIGARNNKSSIHVHVVAGKIESNQALENDGPSREGGGEEDDETSCGTAIGDHVKDGAEASGLLVDSRSIAIEGIEKA
jgi:hypothetical protein